MSINIGTIEAVLKLNDQLSAAFADAVAKMKAGQADIQQVASSISATGSAGNSAVPGLTAAAAATSKVGTSARAAATPVDDLSASLSKLQSALSRPSSDSERLSAATDILGKSLAANKITQEQYNTAIERSTQLWGPAAEGVSNTASQYDKLAGIADRVILRLIAIAAIRGTLQALGEVIGENAGTFENFARAAGVSEESIRSFDKVIQDLAKGNVMKGFADTMVAQFHMVEDAATSAAANADIGFGNQMESTFKRVADAATHWLGNIGGAFVSLVNEFTGFNLSTDTAAAKTALFEDRLNKIRENSKSAYDMARGLTEEMLKQGTAMIAAGEAGTSYAVGLREQIIAQDKANEKAGVFDDRLKDMANALSSSAQKQQAYAKAVGVETVGAIIDATTHLADYVKDLGDSDRPATAAADKIVKAARAQLQAISELPPAQRAAVAAQEADLTAFAQKYYQFTSEAADATVKAAEAQQKAIDEAGKKAQALVDKFREQALAATAATAAMRDGAATTKQASLAAQEKLDIDEAVHNLSGQLLADALASIDVKYREKQAQLDITAAQKEQAAADRDTEALTKNLTAVTEQYRLSLEALKNAVSGNRDLTVAERAGLAEANALRARGMEINNLYAMSLVAMAAATAQNNDQANAANRILTQWTVRLDDTIAKMQQTLAGQSALTAATASYGSEIAKILDKNGLLGNSQSELFDKMLAAALRAKSITEGEAKTIREKLSDQLATVDALQRQTAQTELLNYATKSITDLWEKTGQEIEDTIATVLSGGKVNFHDMIQSWLKDFIKAIEEMVVRWIAAQQAMKAYQVSMEGLGGGSGSGGASGMMGIAGQAMSTYASGSGAGASSMWSSAGSMIGYAFLAYVGMNIVEGFMKPKETAGSASIGGGMGGDVELAQQAQAAVQSLVKQVTDLAAQWNLGLKQLTSGSVTIQLQSNGQIVVKTFLDSVGKAFTDMNAALDYAKVQALKFAEFGKNVSDIVKAVIANTKAEDTNTLQQQIQDAIKVSNFGIPDLVQSARQMEAEMDRLRASMLATLPAGEQLTKALANIGAEELMQWTTLTNQAMGIKLSPAEQLKQQQLQATMLKAEMQLREADLKSQQLDLQSKRDFLAARIAAIQTGATLNQTEINLDTEFLKGRGILVSAQAKLDGAGLAAMQAALQVIDAQLAAIGVLIDGLDELIKKIDPSKIKLPSAGGKGGATGQTPAEWLAQQIQQFNESLKGPLTQAIDAIRQKFADQSKTLTEGNTKLEDHIRALERQAHQHGLTTKQVHDLNAEIAREQALLARNQAALAALNAERDREIREAQRQQREQVRADVGSFLRQGDPYGSAIAGIQDSANKLFKELQDALAAGSISATEFANKMKLVQQQAADLQFNSLQSSIQGILEQLYGYFGDTKDLEAMKHAVAVSQLLAAQAQLEAAIASATITDAQRAELERLMAQLNPWIARAIADPHYGAWSTFNQGMQDLSKTTVQTDTALKTLIDAFHKAKDGIQSWLDSTARGQLGIVTPRAALEAAESQFQAIYNRARGGDLTALQGAPQAATDLVNVLKQFSPALAAVELPKIMAEMRDLLSVQTVHDPTSNLTYTERFVQQQQVTNTTLNSGFSSLSSLGGQQVAQGTQQLNALASIDHRLSVIQQASTPNPNNTSGTYRPVPAPIGPPRMGAG